jgi:Tol biopolymer transport system component
VTATSSVQVVPPSEVEISALRYSPDGKSLAFPKRFSDSEGGLVIANTDGTGERRLVSHKLPYKYWDLSWPPDGEIIACCVEDQKGSYLLEVRVADGADRVIRFQPGEFIFSASWLADGTGLIVSGGSADNPSQQVSLVSYSGGESRRVTNDLLSYNGVSVAADSSAMVAVQEDLISSIWILIWLLFNDLAV